MAPSRRKALSTAILGVGVVVPLAIAGAASYFVGVSNAGTTTSTATQQASTVTQTQVSTLTQMITQTSSFTLLQFNVWSVSSFTPRTVLDAGKGQSFYSSNGLSPSWILPPSSGYSYNYANYQSQVANGTQIGFGITSDILVARSLGLPIKIVAGLSSGTSNGFYVLSNSPLKTG